MLEICSILEILQVKGTKKEPWHDSLVEFWKSRYVDLIHSKAKKYNMPWQEMSNTNFVLYYIEIHYAFSPYNGMDFVMPPCIVRAVNRRVCCWDSNERELVVESLEYQEVRDSDMESV